MKLLPDPRAVVLALVLAVATALPVFVTAPERRDFYFFDASLTTAATGFTGVRWDSGQGLNDIDASVQPLRGLTRPVTYRYMLPTGRITDFRFAPVDQAAAVSITNARIVDNHGRVIRAIGPADLTPSPGLRISTPTPGTLAVEITDPAAKPELTLSLPAPLELPVTLGMQLRAAAPVALLALVAGLVLSFPPVLAWLRRLLAPAILFLRDRPRTAIALTALAAVALQANPVIFSGRSFVSPANGSLMLYGHLPTLPGMTQSQYVDGMASDVGAMLFNHLYVPMLEHEALAQGEWPLWNRASLAGAPLLGQGQSMFGDPFNFLTIAANGAAWAWDLRFLLAHVLLAAGLGTAVWQLTRHLPSALLTTVGGAFLSYFTYRINHPANFSVGYAPWILVAWIGLTQSGNPRSRLGWCALLLLANWTELASGTAKEATMLMVCLNFAGAMVLLLQPATAVRRATLLGCAAVTLVGFVMLSTPLWLTFLDALKSSFTGYDTPRADPLPAGRILGLFDDIFYRQNGGDEFGGAPGLNFLFLGGVLAWLANPAAWRRDRGGLALLLAALLPLAFAFNAIPRDLVVRLPFIGNIIHTGNTFSCVLLILGAVLAGCGLRGLIQAAAGGDWKRGTLIAVSLLGIAGLAYAVSLGPIATSRFFRGYVAAMLLGLAGLALGLRWAARSGRSASLVVALVLALPLLLWRHGLYRESAFSHYAFTPGLRVDIHAPSPAVAKLDAMRSQPGRVIGWDSSLFPAYFAALRWESIYGVDAVRSPHFQELASALGLTRVWIWDDPNAAADAAKFTRAYDLLNVTHSIADAQPGPHAIAGRAPIIRADLDVYSHPEAWPRAFFTDRVAVYGTPADFAGLVGTGDGRPFAAFQAGTTGMSDLPTDQVSRTIVPAHDYRLTPNTTTFTLEVPHAGLAVLSETYYPGDFKVTVDGQPAEYFRVNHAFKAVRLGTPGRHVISFQYWPHRFTLSLWWSATGGLLLAAGGAWQMRRAG